MNSTITVATIKAIIEALVEQNPEMGQSIGTKLEAVSSYAKESGWREEKVLLEKLIEASRP